MGKEREKLEKNEKKWEDGKMGKGWEKDGNRIGIEWEKNGKIGKEWEKDGNRLEKNGKRMENMGKGWEKMEKG